MRIAYLINVYPKISHSFIRREILALEHQGFEVQRIALQGWDSALVDEADWSERTRTRYVLREGMLPILWAVFRTLLLAPTKFLSAVILAIRVGWRSQRPLPFHFFYLAEACRILPWVKSFGATHVHAIDTSMALLQELRSVAGNRPITTHEADLIAFDTLIDEPVDTIVCMGDTLTHLPNRDEVSGLFSMLAANLSAGGRCVISWRDLSSPPQGGDRFIPVRSDDDRVMVCFLEDHGEIVLVNDLVHVRTSDGWTLHKSAYPKLKLSRDWIRGALQDAELAVDFERTDRGMTVLSAVAR